MPEATHGSGIVVGVADMAIGRASGSHLVTYALGSCIGLAAFDPIARVGGILHFMLPHPPEQAERKDGEPFMYATTGIPALLGVLLAAGAKKERLVVCAAGGAEILVGAGVFMIGKRNCAVLRKVLWKEALVMAAEDLGGKVARTMTLDLATGLVKIRSRGLESVLWKPTTKMASAKRGTQP